MHDLKTDEAVKLIMVRTRINRALAVELLDDLLKITKKGED